jgi:demethylmenaquinone methyltransferase/2-methoxy-6-polyprenyl-1,4-benzoquinol methylase
MDGLLETNKLKENVMQISRVNRSKEAARTSYNQMSRWYDLISGRSEWKFCDEGLQMLKAKSGENILEIGFGTGHSLIGLAESVGGLGHIHGIDLSEGMLSVAKSRIERADLLKRIDLRCGDATNLSYQAETFEAIFSSFTLELFDTPEIPLVLKECWRVLKPQGRICIVSLSKYGKQNSALRWYEWAHKKFPNIIDCRPIFVQKALSAAGFELELVACHSMWGLPVEIVLGFKVFL